MKKILFTLTLSCIINMIIGQTVYPNYVDGQVYIKFTSGALKQVSKDDPRNIPVAKLTSVNRILNKYGVTKAYKPFYQADDDARLPYILKVEFSQKNKVNALIDELVKATGVEYAEKVPLMTTFITPNDPIYPSQVHLPQINAPSAWNVFNGNSNITVAIVDNAVMYTHVDLIANTYTNAIEAAGTPGVDDDANGYIDDINGYDVGDNDNNAVPTNSLMNHGTHCAGIAGATNNNGIGVGSIGWNIKIIPVKCTPDNGNTTTIANGYGGIIYAAKTKARVISCSWGGPTAAAAEQTVIDYAWNKGCIIVAAAGNSNTNAMNYPGAYNNIYCVASVSSSNVKSSFTNYGTTTNAWVDIAAPGENIWSTVPYTTTAQYQQMSGTSMATPLVAGLCGLMLSKCSFMTQTDVLNCITNTAANIYTIAANATYSTNFQLGKGRIDAFAAMNCAAGFLTTPPIANFYTLTRVTCPNTLISFQDSSLYAPSNFTWTFQSGIPATSTSSAPTVQWSTPGTYSVSLKVANANGNNTATKVSYITVTNPIALPLAEGFQTLPFLPNNWSSFNIGNDNVFWNRVTGVGGFTVGAGAACTMFDNYNFDATGDRDEMRTPKYIFTNVAVAKLRFDVAYTPFDAFYSDSLNVKLSTNCGTSWTSVYTKGGAALATAPTTVQATIFSPTATQWRTDSVNISPQSAGQGNVMLSFENRGHYGQALYLDNINLFFPAPVSNFNLPASSCVGSAQTLTNTTTGAASYTWSFPGGSPAASNAANPSVTYASTGVYTITVNSQNGTSISSITKTISVTSGPPIVVNTPTICSGTAAVLNASGVSTYTWSTGPNTASISVTPTVTSTYTVNGTSGGCLSTMVATVMVNATPNVSVNNQTICPGGTATITASGATTYSWNTGFNGNPLTVTPATSTNYTVTGTSLGCANSKTVSVSVGTSLSVLISASQQSVCASGTTTLTASGATSYTWNTGSTAPSIVVSPTSNATYSVIGSNGACSGNNTTNISVVPAPAIALTASPSYSVCQGNTATLTASGSYTSYAWTSPNVNGASIAVSPSVSTNYTVTGSGNGGCTTSSVVALTINQNPSAVTSNTIASCSTCPNGAIDVSASGGSSPYTYTWMPGSNNTAYVFGVVPGCYTVSISDANQCTTQATTCVSFATGIASTVNSSALIIYPNPAQSFVTIEYQGMNFSYVVYNNLGQLISEKSANQNSANINVTEFAKGIYTLVIQQGNETTRKKLVIE
ncbi:MAG: S8 family serine peptidase [Bacteroidetes bacterium]|nr:S8 family serine peptidase [Bacteroidota bacterium]